MLCQGRQPCLVGPDGGADEAQAAVDAAAHCFETSPRRWDPMTRTTVLSHLADAFDSRSDGLVASLCRENGKLRRESGLRSAPHRARSTFRVRPRSAELRSCQ
ncbi:aldehyde dehydrogenase family protein [Streptomyces sp. NPDC006654]|uniref:aldehyde dehydrogenase family protein n=1 Tax=unclassified Streptomyces TaxID=2593676 RepID=UPI0033E950CA